MLLLIESFRAQKQKSDADSDATMLRIDDIQIQPTRFSLKIWDMHEYAAFLGYKQQKLHKTTEKNLTIINSEFWKLILV